MQPNTFTVVNPTPVRIIQVVEAQEITQEDKILQHAKSEARRLRVSFEKMNNLFTYESRWEPKVYNEKSGDRGIAQINEYWHKEVTDKQAFDPYWSITWATERVANGYEHEWVVCACASYIRVLGVDFPKGWNAEDFIPNTYAFEGAVAIFEYDGVFHVALIDELKEDTFTVREANYEPCALTEREIGFGDPHILGFYSP